ncbi:hypothetical protein NDU88_003967 [Pleurodeles waltl]|uniref:Uncharacterized protein n=1 Tax=Pleurodeles waltl TaxID=8319 RepID=A0AAV7M7U4_PLEWA|nr:hypothetical protein NDU88_003967 [Pleurodeles waltl]
MACSPPCSNIKVREIHAEQEAEIISSRKEGAKVIPLAFEAEREPKKGHGRARACTSGGQRSVSIRRQVAESGTVKKTDRDSLSSALAESRGRAL